MESENFNLEKELMNLSQQDLVDIIMQKVGQDFEYRLVIENMLKARTKKPNELIKEFSEGIEMEMSYRYPSSYMIRSLTQNLRVEMDKWGIVDTCNACIQVIKSLDEALCNGAGMEDEEDFSITCDAEDMAHYAASRIKQHNFSKDEYNMVSALLSEFNLWRSGVIGRDTIEEVVEAL